MSESETIRVENGTDVILALLFAGGSKKANNEEIVGNTRLDKLIFLLEEETSLKKYLSDFNYEPYNFGPFSSEVFDALQALINAGLVKVEILAAEGALDEVDRFQVELETGENAESSKATNVYSLTLEGIEVASALFNALTKEEQEELIRVKKTFNSLTLRNLIQYVYRKYPKYTTSSIIKDSMY